MKRGIVEQAPEPLTGEMTFYLPHKPVIKQSADTTEVRIVFDASANNHYSHYFTMSLLEVG